MSILKFIPFSSSANSKLWEIELANLKTNNSRLTNTLQECAVNVEEWKTQLEAYKRENQRLKQQIMESENAVVGDKSDNDNNVSLKLFEQVELLRKRSDTLHKLLAQKDEEVVKLKEELQENVKLDAI